MDDVKDIQRRIIVHLQILRNEANFGAETGHQDSLACDPETEEEIARAITEEMSYIEQLASERKCQTI